ncbi:hypothetical protein ACVWZ6_001631 [Bradyrhizobium sp. GM6.1]
MAGTSPITITMANPFLVHDERRQSPQTHVLVIGVGDYPHLRGGTGSRTDDNDGMGQLSSPPISAFAFADWLIRRFNNPHKPLGSVRLLVAARDPRKFVNPASKDEYRPAAATADMIVKAVAEWKREGDADPDNMLLFYFCGHGISAGVEMALLASDYGANPDNSLDGAIDLRRLILGMDQCAATEQIYFVDACRSSSDTLITAQSSGRLVIQPRTRDPALPRRRSPTYYATLKGEAAYGVEGAPTVFTNALISSLDKFGADDEEGDWRVNTNKLADALDHLITRARATFPGLAQVPVSSDYSKFHLHYLKEPPEALVYLSCEPAAELHAARITYSTRGKEPKLVPTPPPDAAHAEILLESGSYEFEAVLTDKTVQLPWYVSPVYRRITFK